MKKKNKMFQLKIQIKKKVKLLFLKEKVVLKKVKKLEEKNFIKHKIKNL